MKKVGVNFGFSDLQILSCTDEDDVRLRCIADYTDEDGVLYVPRAMFTDMVHAWLNHKQRFCEVSVWVTAREIEEGDEIKEIDDLESELRRVRGFHALEFLLLPPSE